MHDEEAARYAVLEELPAGVWEAEAPEGRIRFANHVAIRMLGFPASDWFATPRFLFERVAPEDRESFLSHWQAVAAGEDERECFERLVSATGAPIWSRTILRCSPAPGRVLGLMLRSERRRIEGELDASNEFLAVAAHELRTPGAAVAIALQTLSRLFDSGQAFDRLTGGPSKTAARLIETSERNARRMTQLLDSLLDVTRLHAGKLELARETTDLVALVRAAVERMAGQSASEVRIEAEQAVVGRWDPGRLDQVITNLLTNASKFGGGKPVRVGVDVESGHPRMARLRVIDQGIGIPADRLADVFRRFSRAAPAGFAPGAGLGLYVVQQLVDAHGGSVSVESALSSGSVFTIRLPAGEEET